MTVELAQRQLAVIEQRLAERMPRRAEMYLRQQADRLRWWIEAHPTTEPKGPRK